MTTVTDPRVTVLDRQTVSCDHEASLAAIESPFRLGPMDHRCPSFVPIAVVFVYRQPQSTHEPGSQVELIPIQRLQRALALLLDYYPHLTGRFEVNVDDKTPQITRLGMGAQLLSANCSVSLETFNYSSSAITASDSNSRILITNLPAGGNALLGPFDPTLEGVCRDPIFTIQHTRFLCGSVSLGVTVHHWVCDSEGFFQLVRDLAELYRGIPSLETETSTPRLTHPHIRSYMWELYRMTPEERREALGHQPLLFQVRSNQPPTIQEPSIEADARFDSSTALVPPPPVIGRVLRFSASELDALKALATDSAQGGWVSTFEALTAHLYQRVYLARVKHALQTSELGSSIASAVFGDLLTPINWRGPSRLNLPPRYFPNALLTVTLTLPYDTLAHSPLSHIAKAVHDVLRLMDNQEAIATLRWLAAQPVKTDVTQDFRFPGGGFMVTQWCKFDMYTHFDFDVDQGGQPIPPTLVAPPFTSISLLDGYSIYLATEDQLKYSNSSKQNETTQNQCAIDVNLSLSESIWAILDQDPHFRRFV